jgi:hypothetical protein
MSNSHQLTDISGANMLAKWLAESRSHECRDIGPWLAVDYRCVIATADRVIKGYGTTPDAAMKAAVEAARKAKA